MTLFVSESTGSLRPSTPRLCSHSCPWAPSAVRLTEDEARYRGNPYYCKGVCVGESRSLPAPVLILASASPRRAELLSSVGIAFDVHPAHVNEALTSGELPDAYVRRVSEEKALTIALRVPG